MSEQPKKPFRLDVSREWCEKMAQREDGSDVTAGAAPTEPLTDLLNLVEAARADKARWQAEEAFTAQREQAQRLVQENDRMTAECHALIDQLRAQLTTQQAALRETLDLLDRIAGWPVDDWQGLKFHAYELAQRLRQ